MKFTIALADLESLVKTAAPRPRKTDTLKMSACAGRIFVESKGEIAGREALVEKDGAVTVPAKQFRQVLETYKGTQSLTLEGGPDGLRIGTFRMPIGRYDPAPKPPGNFR